MKLQPPPVVNKQVTDDMLRWVMLQPNTVTMNTTTNEFTITPGKGAKDFPIDLMLRAVMVRELIDILSFNHFTAYQQVNHSLMVKKRGWEFVIDNILDLMPFPDYLPHQINKAYECWKYEQDNLDRAMSYELSKPQYSLYKDPYPSREHLEKVKQMITDSMGVSAELLGNNDSRSDIVREAEDSIDDTNKD